jgi:pimeloyl-ACP methyl ester carboxylesterase
MEQFIASKSWRFCAVILLLLSVLLGACGQEPAPTPPPLPSETVPLPPDTSSPPTDTPRVADTPQPTPRAQSTAVPEPVVRFEDAACPFVLPEGQIEGVSVECGHLVVPEDRAQPDGATLRLAVAIFHPADADPEPDPVIYLEGGPGGSPLESIYLAFDQVYAPLLNADRDLIVFDQRGVGFSVPALDCPAVIDLETDLLDNEVGGEELTKPEMYDLMLETLLDCEAALHGVADLTAYNTATNAADVNDLRLALGYDQVNLWGISYGTRLALEVMRDYPEGVRSVVLDSVYPLEVDPFVETPSSVDRALDLLFATCAADEACSEAYPDLRATFFETVDRLNSAPARIEVTHRFTGERYDALLDGDSLVSLVVQFLYQTGFIPLLPRVISDTSQDVTGSAMACSFPCGATTKWSSARSRPSRTRWLTTQSWLGYSSTAPRGVWAMRSARGGTRASPIPVRMSPCAVTFRH